MKKLTKVAAILMALALIVTAFAACSGDKNTDPSKADSSNADTSNSADANAVKYTARKDDGKLIMATNATFPPYEYKDGDKIVGIDAEVAEKIAEKLGKELVIEDVEFGSIIAGVQTGKFDIGMAGMTVTPEREKSVNFTKSYAKGVQAVIVTEDSPIKSLDDLKGDGSMKFGVQQDTTGDIYASDTAENGGYGEENVIRFKAATDTVQALKSGKVDAVIIDNEPAKSFVASTSGLKILDGAWVDED